MKMTLILKKERETKGTVRFAAENKDESPISTLYINKPDALKFKSTIQITVEDA